MQIEGFRRFFMAGFMMTFLLPAYSQNRLVSFEKELQALETYKNTLGVSSIEYADQLANMAIVFRDTTFHDYYNQLSKIIVADHWTVRDHFGIDSEVYRAILVYLSHTYTFGRFFNTVNLDYKPLVRQLLLSLEDKINDVEYNKHEFYSLISNIYLEDKDFKNVIKWRKRAIDKIGKSNSIDEYFYDIEFLAGAYYNTKQTKLFQKTASILFADEDIRNEQKQMAFSYLLGQINLSSDEEWGEENARFLLNQYQGLNGINIDQERLIYYLPAQNGDLKFLKLIEEVCLSKSDMSLQQKFDYYLNVSMCLSQDAKDQKSSIEYCHKAMEVMEQIGTCESKFMKNGRPYYEMMGFRYSEDKNYLKAIEYYIKGLDDIENCQGADNDNYISLAKTISSLYSIYLADNTNSLLYNRKALFSIKKLYGIQSKEYCDRVISIIADMRLLNRFDEAQALCDSTISFIKTNPELKRYLSGLYNQRGLIASDLHYTRKAIENFNKAVETADDINDAISFLLNRDSFWGELGFDATSNFLYIDSLINTNPDVSDKTRFTFYNKAAIFFADSDKELANRYYNLADYYSKDLSPHRKVLLRLSQSLSETNQAKRYSLLLDAINIFEENHLKDSMVLANVYSKLAGYYEDVQDYNNAIDHYIKAIKIYNSINVDVTNHSFLTCLNNVGLLMSDVNTLKFVYDTRKKHLSPFSPVLYASFKNLISKSLKKGDVEFADSLFKKDGLNYIFNDEAIYENRFLSSRIKYYKGDILGAIDNLSELEIDLEKFPHHQISYYETLLGWKRKAGHDVYDIWEKLLRFYKRKIISKLLYYSNSERKNILFEIQYYMNDLVKDGKDDPRFMHLIADYSLFSKGLLLTTGHQIQKILRKDKTAQQLFRECRSKRIKRNSLSPSDSLKIAALDREITLLEKQISDRVGPRDLTKHLNFSSSDLFKTIGKKQMAIDFILTESDSIKDYYAMIYRDNKLDYIHLFSNKDIARYEGMGESGINAMSKPLFGKLVWGKLLPHINNCDELYFSPTGVLNNFAIELLPILRDSVPDIAFHRVLKLEKEMIDKPRGKVAIKEIVAFGNVDYDTFTNESTDRGMNAWHWGQLKATAAELQDLQNAYTGSHLGFYEKNNATEGHFKQLDNKEINLIHLATHGFYISDRDLQLSRNTVTSNHYINQVAASEGQGRGGLLLSGANYSWNNEIPDSIEDGILATEEIEELSFNNLELVVLSACETGLGESNTDGVWGLQRAFRVAGARRQVVSLLKVDDERTMEFMGELHRNISESHNVYDSFKKAQSYMYGKYKHNPRFWASFILLE